MFLEKQAHRVEEAIHTAAAPPKHKKKGGESISVCLLCQKAFKSAAFYRKHLRLHSDSSKAPCPTCGKGVRKHLLAAHRRLKHKHLSAPSTSSKTAFSTGRSSGSEGEGVRGERPFCCSLCPKSFNIKSSLQRHLSCHTGEKPFLCGLCGRGYTRRSVLQLHVQQVHEARKPFECAACGLCFSQKGNLQAHHRRKHTPAALHAAASDHPKKTKRRQQAPPSSSLHTYASKVKAIVSRGGQKTHMKYPEPPTPLRAPSSYSEPRPSSSHSEPGPSSVDSRSSLSDSGEGEALPDLDALLEGEGWEEYMAHHELLPPPGKGCFGGEWEDCPVFTADDMDEIGEISGNIYGLDGIKTEAPHRHCRA